MSLDKNNNSLGSNKLGFILGGDDDADADENNYNVSAQYTDTANFNNQTSYLYENILDTILDSIIKLFDFISL